MIQHIGHPDFSLVNSHICGLKVIRLPKSMQVVPLIVKNHNLLPVGISDIQVIPLIQARVNGQL